MYNTELAERLVPGARITVLTGAGISAASGIPTFRGADGLWRPPSPSGSSTPLAGPAEASARRRPFRAEDLATPQAFARDPRLVWEWYDWRRGLIAKCRPNRGHDVLAAWSRRFPRFTLITQNVDGLHEAAGTREVITLHGSIWRVRCAAPCAAGANTWEDRRVPLPEYPPACRHCGAPIRPAVVWFGESLDADTLARAVSATECDVFLAVGTSAVVYPAAGLLVEAKRRGAYTVEINPAATDASGLVDLAIAERAEVALNALYQQSEKFFST